MAEIGRVLVVGTAAYVTLVVVLRLSGKRTLAKLNAFDLVVTVALGSTLATILLDTTVTWLDGATALVLLAVLQFAVAWTTVRLRRTRSVVTARPTLLLWEGNPRDAMLRQQRVSIDELRQAVRASGVGDLREVAAVVLESDGTLNAITTEQFGNGSALHGVEGAARTQP